MVWLALLNMCICACRYGLTEEQKATVETQYTELIHTAQGSQKRSPRDLCGELAVVLTSPAMYFWPGMELKAMTACCRRRPG